MAARPSQKVIFKPQHQRAMAPSSFDGEQKVVSESNPVPIMRRAPHAASASRRHE